MNEIITVDWRYAVNVYKIHSHFRTQSYGLVSIR